MCPPFPLFEIIKDATPGSGRHVKIPRFAQFPSGHDNTRNMQSLHKRFTQNLAELPSDADFIGINRL